MRPARPLIVAALALLALPAIAMAQTAELQERLSEARNEREQLAEDLDEVRRAEGDARARLAEVDGELSQALADLEQLEQLLEASRSRLDDAERRSRESRAQLQEAVEALDAAEAQLADKRARLEARVVAAFKYGQIAFAEAFVGTVDIADFLNSSTYVAHILDQDRQLVEDVTALVGDIEHQRELAQALRLEAEQAAADAAVATAEVEAAAAEQERLTELVADRHAERERALDALRQDRASIEGHLAGREAESGRIQSQLAEIARQQREADEAARRAEEEAAAQAAACQAAQEAADQEAADQEGEEAGEGDADPDGEEETSEGPDPCDDANQSAPSGGPGGWVRPVGGPVTSPFGPRWGRNHNGVDLGGPVGDGVVAARAGTVVHVTNHCHPISSWGCGGGFGNYVTIAHDGGMATIYAHLSAVSVGTGQQVGAGQAVGQVGNSGNSYGSHLHLEVLEAGVPKNPCGYISC